MQSRAKLAACPANICVPVQAVGIQTGGLGMLPSLPSLWLACCKYLLKTPERSSVNPCSHNGFARAAMGTWMGERNEGTKQNVD